MATSPSLAEDVQALHRKIDQLEDLAPGIIHPTYLLVHEIVENARVGRVNYMAYRTLARRERQRRRVKKGGR